MVRFHRIEAALQKCDVRLAAHEAHVCDRVDERIGRFDRALAHEIRPELTREIELGIDLQRARDIDGAVRLFARVIELAKCRVARSGVIPRVGTLDGGAVEALVDRDPQARLELFEHRRERRAHDARTHEHDIELGGFGRCRFHRSYLLVKR